eukprot:s3895_g8.t1
MLPCLICILQKASKNMACMLKIAASEEHPKRFDKLEKAYGLVFHPLGLPWCRDIADICNPITNNCWDWMHILMASGGVAQYEFNQYTRRLCKTTGMTLAALDGFAAQVQWPKKAASWPKNYFQKRVVNEDDAHVKAFASELFQYMEILNVLVHVLVWPGNILQQETACLESMMNIISLLSMQENVLRHLPQLEHDIAKHHQLFLDLYPECNKPKTHWLRHVPPQLLKFKCNLSCFSPERKHKGVKTLANKVFSNVEKGVFYRAVAEDLASFQDEHSLLPVFLERPKSIAEEAWLQPLFPGMQAAYGSKTLRFEGGYLQQKDLIWLPEDKVLVQAEIFLQVSVAASSNGAEAGETTQLWESQSAQASSEASGVAPLNTPETRVDGKPDPSTCTTCKKPVNEENSIVLTRCSGKQPTARRCKACHSLRSRINRVVSRHGSLAQDWTNVTEEQKKEFYKTYQDAAGEDLLARMQEAVLESKRLSTPVEFDGTGEYFDEQDMNDRYKNKPEQLQNIFANTRRFFAR